MGAKKPQLKLNTYAIVARAVEQGIGLGWRRAHKHTDTPGEGAVLHEIEEAIMACLGEVVKWE